MNHDCSADSSWSELRATRWRPPGAAGSEADRSATYVFALEQAEQMFRAAATVGPPVRPLLLFYGLSQAGRAIAAAALKLNASDWRLTGHGIATPDLNVSLAEILIGCDKPGSSGSFRRLSELLGSPVWDRASRPPLRVFWDAIPENRNAPLVDDESRRTPLQIEHRSLYDPHSLASAPVYPFPAWVINSPDGDQALSDYLSAFPTAQGFDSYVLRGREPDSEPAFLAHSDGWGELLMNWQVDGGRNCSEDEQLSYLRSITRQYLGFLYFFPGIKGSDTSIHPLMAWWVVLFTLSMLARYEPSRWGEYVNVNESPLGTKLEHLLRQAIRVVPSLIAETIGLVA
jgi:hypothetical protein